jgi:rhodanese-related sulfurtransferase
MMVDAADASETVYQRPTAGPVVVTIEADAAVGTADKKPYLILDVRDATDYAQCHLVEAAHYPAHLLNQDKITPEIFRYRSRPDAVIVLYDDDGLGASLTLATSFVQKGYENIRVLHGGLKGAVAKHPLMLEGEPPAHVLPPPPKATARAPAGLGISGRPGSRAARTGVSSVVSASYSPGKGPRQAAAGGGFGSASQAGGPYPR